MAVINTRIVLRNDIASVWQSVNPILAKGEIGIEIDTKKFKIGDNVTAWNDLPYFASSSDPLAEDVLDRIGKVESGLASLTGVVNGQATTLEEHGKSIDDLVAELSKKADVTVIEGINGRIDSIESLVGSRAEGETRSVFEILGAQSTLIGSLDAAIQGQGTTLSALDGRVGAVEQEIVVLKGDGEGSVKKIVDDAIDAWAKEVTDNGTLDTIKEVIDYVAEHKGEATQMLTDIGVLKTDVEGLKAKDITLENQIAALTSGLEGKVSIREGYDLISSTDLAKLAGIAEGAEVNYIKSVSEEFQVTDGQLTLKEIDQSKVAGLPEALLNAGKLDGVQINGVDLDVVNKKVNVAFNENEFVYADGKISLGTISLSKITNAEEGEEIVLNGGNA